MKEKELVTKKCIFEVVVDEFGGVCNQKELKKISEIVYKAYLRKLVKDND